MALQGVLGNGTKLAYSVSSPVSWTRVGQLQNIDEFLALIPEDVDTTVYSTSNIRTSMPGMIEPPEGRFTCLADFDPATSPSHETIRQYQSGSGYATQGAVIWWRIEAPVNRAQTLFRAWEFEAYIKDFTPSLPIDDAQKLEFSIRFSGTGIGVYPVGASQIT